MKNATAVRYTPAGGGRILFVRNDNLYAQTLNRTTRTLEGEPELIQQRVASSPSFYAAHFSVSRTGVVAWRPGTAGLSQVTIFDRRGKGDRHGGSSYRRPDAQARARRDTSARGIQRDRVAAGARPTWAAAVGAGRSGHAVVAGWVQVPRASVSIGNDIRVVERSCHRARDSSRVGEAVRNVVVWKTFLRTARRCCSVEGHWIRRCSRFRWTVCRKNRNLCFRRARRFHMPAFRQTGAGLCTRPPRRGVTRRDLQRRRHLRAAVPGAGITEAGDQPRQLSGVAQGWKGNRVPR